MATLVTCTSSTRPASPALGDMLYETDTGKTIVCSNATGPVYKVYAAESSSYDLDGTNTTTVRPLFHFDAALWNGVDATGNPGTGYSISAATQADPVAITTTSTPGFSNGDVVTIAGVVGMTEINGTPYTVANLAGSTFELDGIDGTGFTAWASGGTVTAGTTLDENYQWTDRAYGKTTIGNATASEQPIYMSSGENSKPYVNCDGGDLLKLSEPYALRGPFTLFGVGKTEATQRMAFIGIAMSKATEGNYLPYFAWGASVEYLFFGHTGSASGVHASAGGSTAYTITRSFIIPRDSSDATSVFIDGDNCVSDGTTWGPSTCVDPMVITQLLKGGAYGSVGEVYEIALWDSDLSAADRNELGAYVVAKYGLSFDNF